MHMNCVLELGLDDDVATFKSADELRFLCRQSQIYHGLPTVIFNAK